MKQILMMIAVVGLVGCGESWQSDREAKAKAEAAAEADCHDSPHPTNPTTAIIMRICFMPATLHLTGSGVNAVGGEERP
jgi:hypothetical protein